MSIVNAVANLLSPAYSTLYLVRHPAMDEAEAKGCYFSGEIEVELDREVELVENNGYLPETVLHIHDGRPCAWPGASHRRRCALGLPRW